MKRRSETILYLVIASLVLNLLANQIWKYLPGSDMHIDIFVTSALLFVCVLLVAYQKGDMKSTNETSAVCAKIPDTSATVGTNTGSVAVESIQGNKIIISGNIVQEQLLHALGQAGGSLGVTSTRPPQVPEEDQPILSVLNIVFEDFAAQYHTTSMEQRETVVANASTYFESLSKKWRMPKRIFELFLITSLEKRRLLHILEFMEKSTIIDAVSKNPEYSNDITDWLVSTIAGTNSEKKL